MEEFDFKKLIVWQKAVEYAKDVIITVEANHSERKHFRLLEQAESSASSIAMNIAEGKGRYSKKEFVQYLYIARGSLFETVTLLHIFAEMKWIDKNIQLELEQKAKELAKMLNGLINSVKKSNN
ncbi:MAG: four helix bundle protein [Cyclobacteriaceae bacterium]|nr:four helix bundle protein [Cyclobacteriaceae bacterium]